MNAFWYCGKYLETGTVYLKARYYIQPFWRLVIFMIGRIRLMMQFFHGKLLKARGIFNWFMCILIPLYFFHPCIVVSAVEETSTIVQNIPDDFEARISFSKVEKTGMIQQFTVSDCGQIATCIGSSCNFNVYDTYRYYDYTIYTDITKTDVILQWENTVLLIYLHFSGVSNESYHLIRVNGFEDYEVISLPVNEKTEKLWAGLPENTSELITNDGRYYLHYGNLMYKDNESGDDYAVTENTSFHPLMLLSIPILTAIIWFGFARKKVKQWEEENHNKS